jgi:glyoxylase-like metal-dependent hydrolase (beta-lactamase superfamily II)
MIIKLLNMPFKCILNSPSNFGIIITDNLNKALVIKKTMERSNMIQFTNEKLSDRITRIRDGSDVCMYLYEGDKRAALIDTGYGIGDLKGYVESLTDKPYDVFVTHGHVDHAAGAEQFDKVYMNLKDVELFGRHCTVDFRKSSVKTHAHLDVDDSEFLPQRKRPFTDLEDGRVDDLGNATIRWIHVPGHTQGTMVPLFVEERTIMFGDACGVGVLLALPESSTAEKYCESLKNLKSYELMYDKVLRQHGTCESTPQVLEDNIENCELILAGKDDAIPTELMGMPCFRARAIDPDTGARVDGREGNIIYSSDHIR